MFDFEKLDLYTVVREQNFRVYKFINKSKIDSYIAEQWKKESLGIVTNLVEGTGRISTNDKRKLFTAARGCVFESTAMLQFCLDSRYIKEKDYDELYATYEQISKMLLGLYRSQK
jgi:four helix bundle protein